jgi:anti-anti-sigma factor
VYGDTVAWIQLRGEIDLACRPGLNAVVRQLETGPPSRAAVDLSEVAFLGCEGLGFFIRLRGATGDTVTLLNTPRLVRRVLDVGGLAQGVIAVA